MERFKLGGVALLALGLCFACQKKDDAGDDTNATPSAGSGGSSTTTMMPGGGSSTMAAGGDGEETVRKGERGSSCDSTVDCEDDLTCIVTSACPAGVACANKTCQPSNFNLTETGKSCHVTDCQTKADCCGDMPTQTPTKCVNRDVICNQPTKAGCSTLSCTLAADNCGKGTCRGRCTYGSQFCDSAADCAENTCEAATGYCSLTGLSCSSASPCAVVNLCLTANMYCDCTNPKYDPTNDVCTDKDCEGICGFTCTEERCVADDSCASDEACPLTTPYCNSGKCGECRTSADCDDEMCVSGHCGPECKADTQCGVFEACQSGSCVYVGCRTDRECVLQASSGSATPSQDPRLAKCNIEKNVGTCVLPCDIDAQCSPTEVCFQGVCKYIGCETDSECKTIAGLHDLPVPTPERPWITTAVCKPEDSAAP